MPQVAGPLDAARRRLVSAGAALLPPTHLNACLGVDGNAWGRFGAHWSDLAPDSYAAERGTRRQRRYGHFVVRADGAAAAMPHAAFVQPDDSNPLYLGRDRHFEPLTAAFNCDQLLGRLLRMLHSIATALDDAARWSAKVTPFRVLAAAGGEGQPTPEGLHRDGVTLVTSLLVGRGNAVGGQSSVYDMRGRHVLTTTLSAPGTLLLGDDRRTVHGVSSIRPLDPAQPARRDVLVITFAPC